MQYLLRCSHLPIWRFHTQRACNTMVKARTVTDSLTEYAMGYLDNTWNKLLLNFRKPREWWKAGWTSFDYNWKTRSYEILQRYTSLIPKSVQVWNLMLSHVPFFFVPYTHLFSIQKLKHNYLWQKPSGMHHRPKSWAPTKTGLYRKKAVARSRQTSFHM